MTTRTLALLLRLLLSRQRSLPPPASRDSCDDLHALARSAFDFEHARYDAAETKAARYLTVLGLVLAVAAIKTDDLLWTLRHASVTWRWRVPFVISYFVTFGTAFWAVLLSLRAMSVEQVPALPLDDQLPALFRDHPRPAAVGAMAEAFFTEAKELRAINGRRSKDLTRICCWLKVTLWAAAFSLILYAGLSFTAPDRASLQNGVPMTKPSPPAPSQQPNPSGAPASVPPPKFDTIKKGDSSPTETRTPKPE